MFFKYEFFFFFFLDKCIHVILCITVCNKFMYVYNTCTCICPIRLQILVYRRRSSRPSRTWPDGRGLLPLLLRNASQVIIPTKYITIIVVFFSHAPNGIPEQKCVCVWVAYACLCVCTFVCVCTWYHWTVMRHDNIKVLEFHHFVSPAKSNSTCV